MLFPSKCTSSEVEASFDERGIFFLPEVLEFLAQYTKTKKIFFSNFFANCSPGNLPCNSTRVAPIIRLDVREVSAQNPRKNEKSFLFLSKWNTCGKLEVSSNSHANFFLPKVQKLFAKTPKTKKNFPPTIMFPSSDSSGPVRCSSDRLAQRFQPEVGKISAQNQERNQKNIHFFSSKCFSRDVKCTIDKFADVFSRKSKDFSPIKENNENFFPPKT